jgi:hypothetical protein
MVVVSNTNKIKRGIMKKNVLKLALTLTLICSSLFLFAQTEDQDQDADVDLDDQEEVDFFNSIEEERFKTNLSGRENGKIGQFDYSRDYKLKSNSSNYNILEGDKNFQNLQYNKDETHSNGSNQNGRIVVGSPGSNSNSGQNPSKDLNFEMPMVHNPYSQNPGVKAPRNMDAVPDNGDDPSDVPLDSEILILLLSALIFGYYTKYGRLSPNLLIK